MEVLKEIALNLIACVGILIFAYYLAYWLTRGVVNSLHKKGLDFKRTITTETHINFTEKKK